MNILVPKTALKFIKQLEPEKSATTEHEHVSFGKDETKQILWESQGFEKIVW